MARLRSACLQRAGLGGHCPRLVGRSEPRPNSPKTQWGSGVTRGAPAAGGAGQGAAYILVRPPVILSRRPWLHRHLNVSDSGIVCHLRGWTG